MDGMVPSGPPLNCLDVTTELCRRILQPWVHDGFASLGLVNCIGGITQFLPKQQLSLAPFCQESADVSLSQPDAFMSPPDAQVAAQVLGGSFAVASAEVADSEVADSAADSPGQ